MRLRLLVTALVAAGCASAAVQPTLADVQSLGYACGDGIRDNVPSGLSEWHCSGTAGGRQATINVDGNDGGVAGITLAIDSPDPDVLRAAFQRLATEVAPVKVAPSVRDALVGWSGQQQSTTLGNARVTSECDATQCFVEITSVDGPLQPLRLP